VAPIPWALACPLRRGCAPAWQLPPRTAPARSNCARIAQQAPSSCAGSTLDPQAGTWGSTCRPVPPAPAPSDARLTYAWAADPRPAPGAAGVQPSPSGMARTGVVGRWQLEAEIGSGSFAVVWRARHQETGQLAAVKEINTDKLNRKLQESLASEVHVLDQTKHPNIVGLLDLFKVGARAGRQACVDRAPCKPLARAAGALTPRRRAALPPPPPPGHVIALPAVPPHLRRRAGGQPHLSGAGILLGWRSGGLHPPLRPRQRGHRALPGRPADRGAAGAAAAQCHTCACPGVLVGMQAAPCAAACLQQVRRARAGACLQRACRPPASRTALPTQHPHTPTAPARPHHPRSGTSSPRTCCSATPAAARCSRLRTLGLRRRWSRRGWRRRCAARPCTWRQRSCSCKSMMPRCEQQRRVERAGQTAAGPPQGSRAGCRAAGTRSCFAAACSCHQSSQACQVTAAPHSSRVASAHPSSQAPGPGMGAANDGPRPCPAG